MYERPRIRGVVYTDTMDGQHKSLDGNKFAQVFATDFHFSAVYPMESKGHAGEALKQFIIDFGVPDKIICDGSKEQTKRGTTFMEQVRKHHIDVHTTEPNQHNQSKVEGVIRELRKNWFRTMHRKRVPRRLWDYGLKWASEVRVKTSSDAADLKGRTPLERVTGDTVDISEYLDFGFYESREEVALDGIEEGAGAGTKSSGMQPLDQFLLCLGGEKGVGVMMAVVGLKRKAPKAVW